MVAYRFFAQHKKEMSKNARNIISIRKFSSCTCWRRTGSRFCVSGVTIHKTSYGKCTTQLDVRR